MSSVSTLSPVEGKLRRVSDQKCQEESLELGGSMAVFRHIEKLEIVSHYQLSRHNKTQN